MSNEDAASSPVPAVDRVLAERASAVSTFSGATAPFFLLLTLYR